MTKFNADSRLHLALNVSNIEQSLEFYKALFDMEPSKLKPGYAKFEVNSPAVNFTLNQSKDITGNQINHLGIQVKASQHVKAQQERLQQLGIATKIEENTTCCYAVQDKVWVHDPDGNAWETFVVYEDSEHMHPPSGQECCVEEKAQPALANCCG